MPPLEAIEQRASSLGIPVESRVARGRSYRDALRRILEKERFDRIIVSVPENERAFRRLGEGLVCGSIRANFGPRLYPQDLVPNVGSAS